MASLTTDARCGSFNKKTDSSYSKAKRGMHIMNNELSLGQGHSGSVERKGSWGGVR